MRANILLASIYSFAKKNTDIHFNPKFNLFMNHILINLLFMYTYFVYQKIKIKNLKFYKRKRLM